MSSKTNQKVKQTGKLQNKSKKRTFFNSSVVYSVTFLVGIATVLYIKYLLRVPDLPEVKLDEYWGPYPMSDKPDLAIKPYTIEFSDAIIGDLKERLLHTRPLPQPLDKAGFTYGFNSHFLTQVVDYWANKYNCKERERFLNQYEHFRTEIQGLNIHFMHVKPSEDVIHDLTVVPILMLHGWPGSVREFYELIPKLLKPVAGRNFVFEVVAPSLPGFGFSDAPARPGFSPMEMAIVLRNLMERLGFKHYYIQGGDVGHTVGSIMATLFPDRVLGFHTNFPAIVFNPLATFYIWLGSWAPSFIDYPQNVNRMYPMSEHFARTIEESGYMHIQATKPDTIGTALSDSPAGLAAYILEKYSTWTNPRYKLAYDGNLLDKYSLTHLLDNVMIYWATNTITASMRIYAETFNKRGIAVIFDRIRTEVPTWGIKFKHELVYQPDCILRIKYTNYLQSTVVDDGGHFAAMENPDIMAKDIFDAVDTFRQFHNKINTNSVETPKTVYDYTVNDINGKPTALEIYKGYVLLIVNVASQCGLTETNYKELNQLHEKYYNEGLRILAFPCNQFNSQEPGSLSDIIKFTQNKGVQFDLFEKVDVNGENTTPLWKFLKQMKGGTLGEFIKWNFSKFIVDRNGVPVERMGPNVNPMDLEPYLIKYL